MFRRKSRSSHNVSYTGVNHSAPQTNQPNSNALAAALSIGQGLKSQPISRSGSMQQISHQKSNSLLKRSPSMSSKISSNKPVQTHLPAKVNRYSSINDRSYYDIDDSMTDSYMDEITEEATPYNNHEAIEDLKLNHSPQVKMVKRYIPTANGIKIVEVPEAKFQQEISRNNSMRSGANIPRSGSMNSITLRTHKQPARRQPSSRLSSLVKSPPLSAMKEELAEYDEIEKKIQEEKEYQRKLKEKRAEYERLRKQRQIDELEFKRLEQELDHDNSTLGSMKPDIQHDIKSTDMLSLSSVQEIEVEKPKVNGLGINSTNVASDTVDDQQYQSSDIKKPVLESDVTDDFINPSAPDEETDSEYSQSASEDILPPPEIIDDKDFTDDVTETLEQTHITDPVIESDGDALPDETISGIDPSKVLVDEVEKKEVDDVAEGSIDPSKIMVDELEVEKSPKISINNEFQPTSEDVRLVSEDEDFGIEEGNFDADDTPVLNKEPKPKFDTVPSIINDELGVSDSSLTRDTLKAPPVISQGNSSASSIGSDDSPSRSKKPMKSALKTSTSSFQGQQSQSKTENAAHQAYLSLTTAENTRLNSKLSSSQLIDTNPIYSQNHHYPGPAATNSPLGKRMSTSLRKPPTPQANGPGLANRSLRPQSQIEPHRPKSELMAPQNGSKLSNRSLRENRASYIQPMNTGQSGINYLALSKTRAAELYAKANSRPHSQFNLNRKSSFNNGSATPLGEPKIRTSMRDQIRPADSNYQPFDGEASQPVQHPTQQQFDQSNAHYPQASQRKLQQIPQTRQRSPPNKTLAVPVGLSNQQSPTTPPGYATTGNARAGNGISSRFADSDDEPTEMVASPASAGIFSTRYADSDDEGDHDMLPYSHPQNRSRNGGQMTTLREPVPSQNQEKKKEGKEKKKLGGRLKKLFGRS